MTTLVIRLLGSGMLVLTLSAVGSAQPPLQLTPPPLTSDGIITAIGSEPDAREVTKLVLARLFQQQEPERFVLAGQIRETWLPAVAGRTVVRLTDSDVDRHLAACGRYWTFENVTRRDNVVSLNVSERCGCTTRFYVASFEDGAWHLGPPRTGASGDSWVGGIGCGCISPPPGCPCFPR